jgi:hypothetical protein
MSVHWIEHQMPDLARGRLVKDRDIEIAAWAP